MARATIMEIHLDPAEAGDYGRICSIDQAIGSGWRHIWHAHFETASCIRQFNRMATRALNRGMQCYLSVGMRYGDPESSNHVPRQSAAAGQITLN